MRESISQRQLEVLAYLREQGRGGCGMDFRLDPQRLAEALVIERDRLLGHCQGLAECGFVGLHTVDHGATPTGRSVAFEGLWLTHKGQEYVAALEAEAGLSAGLTRERLARGWEKLARLATELIDGLHAAGEIPVRPLCALHDAIDRGDLEGLRLAIAAGEDVDECDADERTPLQKACELGQVQAARLLLEAQASRGGALLAAVAAHQAPAVRLLLEWGEDPDETGGDEGSATPVMAAAASGDLAVVKLLVEAGAQVNTCDGEGQTALSLAIEQDRQAVVAYLLPRCSAQVRAQAGL